jgi:hypothetical protein
MAVNNGANSYNEITQAYQPSNFWGNLAGVVASGLLGSVGQGLSAGLTGLGGQGTAGAAAIQPMSSTQPMGYSGPSGGGAIGLAGDLGFGQGLPQVNGPSGNFEDED